MNDARRPHGVSLNGPFLTHLRERQGKKVAEAAKKIGIDPRVLTKAEDGRPVLRNIAELIATHYRVELSSILSPKSYTGPSQGLIIASFDDVVAKNLDIVTSGANI
jgi:hypothetical protein